MIELETTLKKAREIANALSGTEAYISLSVFRPVDKNGDIGFGRYAAKFSGNSTKKLICVDDKCETCEAVEWQSLTLTINQG